MSSQRENWSIPKFRSWLQAKIVELSDPEPEENQFYEAAAYVRRARQIALVLGHPKAAELCEIGVPLLALPVGQQILCECLAEVNRTQSRKRKSNAELPTTSVDRPADVEGSASPAASPMAGMLSLKAAARYLGRSPQYLREVVVYSRSLRPGATATRPTIEFYQSGKRGRILFRQEWLDAFIQEHLHQPPKEVLSPVAQPRKRKASKKSPSAPVSSDPSQNSHGLDYAFLTIR